jgi:hypothetical protein
MSLDHVCTGRGAFMRGGVARAAVQERRDVRAAERLFAARGLDAFAPAGSLAPALLR